MPDGPIKPRSLSGIGRLGKGRRRPQKKSLATAKIDEIVAFLYQTKASSPDLLAFVHCVMTAQKDTRDIPQHEDSLGIYYCNFSLILNPEPYDYDGLITLNSSPLYIGYFGDENVNPPVPVRYNVLQPSSTLYIEDSDPVTIFLGPPINDRGKARLLLPAEPIGSVMTCEVAGYAVSVSLRTGTRSRS